MEDGAIGQQPLNATMDEAASQRHLKIPMELQVAMFAIDVDSLGILLITVRSNARVKVDLDYI
jgi:hypothetical protein